jgi:hypothetical protein
MTGVFEPAETGQFVGIDLAFGLQTTPDPLLQRGVVEGAHRLDRRHVRMVEAGVGGHGDHERLLVLRPAPRLAAIALAAEVGGVDLHETLELARFLALDQGLHDLVLQAPGGLVVDAQVAHQFERGEVGLGGGEQMQGLGRHSHRRDRATER